MSERPVEVSLTEDRTTAILSVPAGKHEFNAHDLSSLIEALGRVRAALLPELPVGLPPLDARLHELSHIEFRQMAQPPVVGGVVMLLRSPYLGWMDYPLDAKFCQELVLFLQGQNSAPPEGTTVQ